LGKRAIFNLIPENVDQGERYPVRREKRLVLRTAREGKKIGVEVRKLAKPNKGRDQELHRGKVMA